MRILITGASGFVGGSFLRRFSQRSGLELFGVGRRAVDLPHYAQRDLSQPFDLPFRPDVVIHAAARAAPWGTRQEYLQQNVEATRQVIAFCRRVGHPRLLYVSTSAVFYREAHQYQLTEDSPIGPGFVNRYAQTKYAGEQLLADYEGAHCILRPRAVFGPGDTVLFPRVIAAARKGTLPLFAGPGGPVMGDLVYIDTLTDYLLRAATAPQLAESYNLTNAQAVDLQALLHQVLQQLGLPLPTRRVQVATALRAATAIEWVWRALRLRGEPPMTRFGVGVFAFSKTFDPRRTLQDLGPPSVTLEDGVERFIAWQKQQGAC
jgi:nucleoside-diphosphate-sugar epimerase